MSWNQLKSILKISPYIQSKTTVHAHQLQSSAQYIISALKYFESTVEDFQRRLLVSSILVAACQLFDDDKSVQIQFDQAIRGVSLNYECTFDFILRRKNKIIAVIYAKHDRIEQGMVRAFLGCEALSEKFELKSVDAVVTNLFAWTFLKSSDDEARMDERAFDILSKPSESLTEITGRLYKMLDDSD